MEVEINEGQLNLTNPNKRLYTDYLGLTCGMTSNVFFSLYGLVAKSFWDCSVWGDVWDTDSFIKKNICLIYIYIFCTDSCNITWFSQHPQVQEPSTTGLHRWWASFSIVFCIWQQLHDLRSKLVRIAPRIGKLGEEKEFKWEWNLKGSRDPNNKNTSYEILCTYKLLAAFQKLIAFESGFTSRVFVAICQSQTCLLLIFCKGPQIQFHNHIRAGP